MCRIQDTRLLFSTKEHLASNYFAQIGLLPHAIRITKNIRRFSFLPELINFIKTSRSTRREQEKADRQRDLLADIKTINTRLLKKDAVKEHEQKMQEYASFMQEIQEYLNEPDADG